MKQMSQPWGEGEAGKGKLVFVSHSNLFSSCTYTWNKSAHSVEQAPQSL